MTRGLIHLAAPILLAILAGTASYWQWFESLDLLLYDTSQQYLSDATTPDVMIVAIDEQSIAQLGRWPWPRSQHAALLDTFTDAGVKAVVFDILFGDPDSKDPTQDKQFSTAIQRNKNVVLPLYFETLNNKGQIVEVPPIASFYYSAAAIGHAHIACDEDGVCRSVFLKAGLGAARWPHASLALHQILRNEDNPTLPGSRFLPEGESSPMLIYQDYHNYIPFNSHQRLPVVSAVDVLNKRIPSNLLRDKIIFVGATAAGVHDILTTPVGRMSGVEISALIYQRLNDDNFIQRAQPLTAALITGLLVAVLLTLISFLTPAQFLSSSLGIVITGLSLEYIGIAFGALWFPAASLTLSVLVFYPLWSWFRLEIALNYLRRSLLFVTQTQKDELDNSLDDLLISQPSNNWRNAPGSEIVSRTIEQLHNANRRLESTRQLMQQSISNLQEGLIVIDESGILILKNPQMETLLGDTLSHSVLALNAKLTLNSDTSWDTFINQLLENGTSFTLEATATFQGHYLNDVETPLQLYIRGHRVAISRSSQTQQNISHSTNVAIITFTDISTLKAIERSRIETLNFISHDLRTPMVSILALINKAKASGVSIDDNNQLLHKIEYYAHKNLGYAESLLQLSRAENTSTEQFRLCDLHAIVDDAHTNMLPLAEEKNIRLVVHKEDADFWIMADFDLLQRALVNLLSNAIKYSSADSTVTLNLHHGQVADTVEIRLEDHGQGIAEKDLPRLFQRFQRLSQHAEIRGAGLGLFFVKTVIVKHEGTIHVESQIDNGSTFFIILPLR